MNFETKNNLFAFIIIFIVIIFTYAFAAKAVTLLTVPQGGTGVGSFTAGECLVGAGTGAITTAVCDAGSSGDVTDVFDCATGNCSTMTVGTSEYLVYGSGYIDANRFAGVTTVNATEFGYLDNVTSAIQTQFSNKQPLESTLSDIADGTIAENLINTANPWADNEVSDTLTISGYMQDEDINTFSEIQSWVTDGVLLKAGTLTDTQYCVWDSTGGQIVCNSTPGGSGDITDVFDCATGNCSTMTVGTGEYLTYGSGYIDANRFGGVTTVSSTEFGYLNGLTAAIVQTGSASHDGFSDFVANEHLDWTADLGAVNLHAGNYTDTNTTYTAGRSLTLDGTAINADAELYHDEKCLYFEDPTAADDFKSLFHFRKAATITGMWCESDQTVNMDLQLDDGTPADINGTDLVCDSTPADDTSLGGDTGAGAGERLDLAITSVSGTPTWVSICFDFTYDD